MSSHHELLIMHLTLTGDGTGQINYAQDYSGAPIYPKVQPPVDKIVELHKMTIYIEDNGAFLAHRFGAAPALVNGIDVQIASNGTVLVDMLPEEKVRTNGHIIHYATDWSELNGTPRSMVASWNFVQSFGQPFRLVGKNLENIRVELHDDFSALDKIEFLVHGHYITDPSSRLSF